MREGFQRPNPDGSPRLKSEEISLPADDSALPRETPLREDELHEQYRAEDAKADGDGWHPAPEGLLQDMDALRAKLVDQKKKVSERKNRAAGNAAHNKRMSEREDASVPSATQLSHEASEQELKAAIKRERAQKKAKPEKPQEPQSSPQEHASSAPGSAESSSQSSTQSGTEDSPKSGTGQSERFKESILGNDLDLKLTSAKLRESSERIAKGAADLQKSEAALRDATARRVDHKKWLDEISANRNASGVDNPGGPRKKGLSKKHAIPEKAFTKADKESVALSQREAQLAKDVEDKKRNIASEEEGRSQLRARAETLLKREQASAEEFIKPYEEQIAHARKTQAEIKESLPRFEEVALDVEKRLNEHKVRLQDAQFDSQRVMLSAMIRKDELLLRRVRSRSGLSRGFGTRKQAPRSIDGLKQKLAAAEEKMHACEAKIAMRKAKTRSLEEMIRESMDTARRPESARQRTNEGTAERTAQKTAERTTQKTAEQPAEAKREAPVAQPRAPEPIATVAYKSSSFEIPYPQAPAAERAVPAKEQVANRFAADWNQRYGSSFMIKPKEFERLLPDDREPDDVEIDSILETFITARASRIWRFPVLSTIFSNITRSRIRAMRAARRSNR